ncbi:hypothetical protein D3C72_1958900 [compost metagenome]
MDIIFTRWLFRNCFEYYMNGNGIVDQLEGSRYTLLDLCRLLEHDLEPFPRRYDPDLRKLCGHEYLTWFRVERTYGDVTRLLARLFAAEDGISPAVGGHLVHQTLKNTRAANYWLQSEKEMTEILADLDSVAG